ncbi:MAG: FAD:protein FMN transferase [Planctomycetes bacterium]|nr:FAD:protein FMN transferase [Planctomycetota bacterium]MBT4029750.1 FAD:protein FMN transferase [Planctomycetota bacterium]MBT4559858.1 FAD:protein FMN transferase [Planctomycetota bacterium]MBT5101140.1 FAD:protein FMN transferase [Planctomycetota bacterium]MBT5120076.1 FAD:protein FMN transferase [Planctomycetota bacterium]
MHTLRLATNAMRTRFELVLAGKRLEHLRAAGEEAIAEIQATELQLSRFLPQSEVSRLNRQSSSAEPIALKLSSRLQKVLRVCRAVQSESGGAFSPMTQQRFDLGGVGKGVALDRAAEALQDAGVESAFLHGGASSVLAWGSDYSTGKPWRVTLPQACGASVELNGSMFCPAALGVSSPSGQENPHIIDPRTGDFVITQHCAVVRAVSATLADAWATALVVDQSFADCSNETTIPFVWKICS